MANRIDLHLHTNISDGSDTVQELYKKVKMTNDCIEISDRCSSFEKLIDNMEQQGFDSNYPILVDAKGNIFNGTHRVAAACYYGINYIPTKKVFRKLKEVSPEKLIRDLGLSAEEIEDINNAYFRIYNSINTKEEC